MKKVLMTLVCLLTSGCGGAVLSTQITQTDCQQAVVMEWDLINVLTPSSTEANVASSLGAPSSINTIDSHTQAYIYQVFAKDDLCETISVKFVDGTYNSASIVQ